MFSLDETLEEPTLQRSQPRSDSATPDEALFAELADLTRRGYEDYVRRGYIGG